MSKQDGKYDAYNVNDEEDFDICNTCSTTDCTGLMPTPPRTDDEYESYQEVYQFQAAIVDDPDQKNNEGKK